MLSEDNGTEQRFFSLWLEYLRFDHRFCQLTRSHFWTGRWAVCSSWPSIGKYNRIWRKLIIYMLKSCSGYSSVRQCLYHDVSTRSYLQYLCVLLTFKFEDSFLQTNSGDVSKKWLLYVLIVHCLFFGCIIAIECNIQILYNFKCCNNDLNVDPHRTHKFSLIISKAQPCHNAVMV